MTEEELMILILLTTEVQKATGLQLDPNTSVVRGRVSEQLVYPTPLKYHIDVVMNMNTFYETLENFHLSMGSKLMRPVLGGDMLDLHFLYFLVTERGGIEKTISDGKWRDVTANLKIPNTVTNRSFVVRKHYIKLLFHYEQVYYFRRQGPIFIPSDFAEILQKKSYMRLGRCDTSIVNNLRLNQVYVAANEIGNEIATSGDNQIHSTHGVTLLNLNLPVVPTIGETTPAMATSLPPNTYGHTVAPSSLVLISPAPSSESTHSVSIPIGNGIVVTSGDDQIETTHIVDATNLNVPVAPTSGGTTPAVAHQTNYQPSFATSSSTYPKLCRTAYAIFFEEKYYQLNNILPSRASEFVKLIDDSWNEITEVEKEGGQFSRAAGAVVKLIAKEGKRTAIYNEKERKDKDRYRREWQEYKQRMGIP